MKANIDLIMVCAGSQGPADKMHVPLGLIYIGSELRRNGYDVKIWHLLPGEFETTLLEICEREPLWIGLSVLSGMTTLHAVRFSKRIKEELPRVPVVWGGHHTSAVPKECLRENYVDFVVHGEGEDTAVELSDALFSNSEFTGILGLGFKGPDGSPLVNASRPLEKNLDRYKLSWELVNLQDYMNGDNSGKMPISFYSSRGCPYKCTFCSTPLYTGKSYRTHSPEYVISNLSYLKSQYGFNSVFFCDDNFMLKSGRGMEIIQRLEKIGITVDTLDLRLNQLDENMLRGFKDHGVQGLFFGFESGNDRILTLMKKGIDIAHIKRKVKLINQFGVTAWASGIIGVPTETRQEVYKTIDLAMWLRDNLPEGSTASTYRYMPLPKTELLTLAVQEGFEYPTSQEDWRWIDPIGPHYEMKRWVKWVMPEDEEYLSLVQELSRNRMLDYVHRRSLLVNSVNNFFVRRARVKVASRKLKMDLELKCFELARDIYSLMLYGKRLGLKSDAIQR
jgi:radical SAM superfamily enzyme YgiQ (UPF0313 family)